MDTYETIAWKRHGRVLEVALDMPDKLNAVGSKMHAELARLFVDCSNDPDSDIIVLTGSGRAFSAGGDLDEMQAWIDDPAGFEKVAREAKQIVLSLLDCEKPIIAKLNGHAIGLGATIALLCDIVFAADTARIGDPHVSVGLVAGDGGATIWPQLIGYAKAREYLLTGDLLTAAEAERLGLINRVVPRDQLDAEVQAFADRLASGATKAIRWTKMTINLPLRQLAESMMNASLAYEALSNVSEDHREAVDALRNKRSPQFTGR